MTDGELEQTITRCQQHGFTPLFRPGTMDAEVWRAVVDENEYGISELQAEDIVVDIGSHIGSFCYLAFEKGSRHIYGYELNSDSFSIAVQNRNLYGGGGVVQLFRCPVTAPGRTIVFDNGSWDTFQNSGDTVAALSLDAIIDKVCGAIGKIRLLKIDCEGSEWEILYTSKKLDRIKEIVGEYHTKGLPGFVTQYYKCTPGALAEHLATYGFTMQWNDGDWAREDGLGNFRAWR